MPPAPQGPGSQLTERLSEGSDEAPRAAPRSLMTRLSGGFGRDFWLMWSGWTISSAGNGLTTIAIPLLAADLTSDPSELSLVSFAGRLPWLLLALLGGVLADRWNRRTAMWLSDTVRFFLLAALAVLAVFGWASIPALMVVAFAITAIETVYDSSRQAILPMLVSKDQDTLQAANSRLQTAKNTALQFVGPAAGGMLYVVAKALPLGIDALSFGLSALLTFLIRADTRVRKTVADVTAPLTTKRRSVRREMAEGCRWLARHRVLRVFTIVAGLKNMCTAAELAMLVLYARQIMHISDVQFGLLLSTVAVGSIVGGFFCRRIAARLGPAVSSLGGSMIGGLGFAVLGFTHNAALVAFGLALTGFTSTMWNVTTVSLRQSLVPAELNGRVNGVNRLVTFGMMPLGTLLGGLIAANLGLVALYQIGGLFGAGVALVGLFAVTNRSIADALRDAGVPSS